MFFKILSGWLFAMVLCVFLCGVLDTFLVPRPPDPQTPVVPYGSNMAMPIFYSGILGAAVGAMIELVLRKWYGIAALIGTIVSAITGYINLIYWLNDGGPLLHYANVIIYMPVTIASGLIILVSIGLLCLAVITAVRTALEAPEGS